ncbi:hypothetical protein LDENG_00007480 [Lucifuga dentata]|nr:hypothetical protein LDENG_00007480 [Lucifuga dentata]
MERIYVRINTFNSGKPKPDSDLNELPGKPGNSLRSEIRGGRGPPRVYKYQLPDSCGIISLQNVPPDLRTAFKAGNTMADASFQQEFLQAHNTYRKKHNTEPLKLNSDLSATAQKWADYLLSKKNLEHSNTEDGENIYYASSSNPMKLTGKEAVDSWYSEIKDYKWNSPGFSFNTGHFTQVAWKETTEVGVGLATDGHTTFVVGQYRPAGNMNMKDYFEENVLPLAGREMGGAENTSSGGSGTSQKRTCTLL